METAQSSSPMAGKTSARDFFLWFGALIALYSTITSLISLLFDYINHAYPDPLAGYADPYGGSVRFSMAVLIVATPTLVLLARMITTICTKDPSKLNIWIRKWGIMLTLFLASAVALGDLITLINTFLGGEITTRFILKVVVVLLIAVGTFLHYLADLKLYWINNLKYLRFVSIGVMLVAVATIVGGILLIGSPTKIRNLRFDDQRVSDLSSIQSQALSYFMTKREVPPTLDAMNDPLAYFTVPVDPQSGASYEYTKTGKYSFTLCATFALPTPDTAGRGAYPATGVGGSTTYPAYDAKGFGTDNFKHDAGHQCFERTIDPARYPATPLRGGAVPTE